MTYRGIILDQEFSDPRFPEEFRVFAKRKSATNSWVIIGVEIADSDIEEAVARVQSHMKSGPITRISTTTTT